MNEREEIEMEVAETLDDWAKITLEDAKKMSNDRIESLRNLIDHYVTRTDDYVGERTHEKLFEVFKILDKECIDRKLGGLYANS